jgi:hypothetical protein
MDGVLLLVPVAVLVGLPVAVGYGTGQRGMAVGTGLLLGAAAAMFQAQEDSLPWFAVPVFFLGVLGAGLGAVFGRRGQAATGRPSD